ncbi:hypothetical protein AB4Y32_09795 [Paraburkholderia phymatum]|uniref:Uncharacterized protein n=1 Tax=Paraburkholderia phymatum TaxID=148447 RepID=A0ACC6TXE0_9BURK
MAHDVRPAPPDALTDRDPVDQIAAMRSMMWGRQLLFDSGYTASGASKRYSPDEPYQSGKEPANSKYIYKVLSGETVLRPGPRGKHNYDIVADVDSDPALKRAKAWFSYPLLSVVDPTVSLAKVRAILHDLAPWFAKEFFFSRPLDQSLDPFWTRRSTDVTHAVKGVNYYEPEVETGRLTAPSDPHGTELIRFVALWCLYREAKLVGDARATAIAHWAIWDAHDRVCIHPTFAHVFQPYLTLVQRLEPESIRALSPVWPPEGESSVNMRPLRIYRLYPQMDTDELRARNLRSGFADVWDTW